MFEQLFNSIAADANETDIAGNFPEKEFSSIANAGLLKIVLPGELMDFKSDYLQQLLHLLKDIGTANLSVGRIYEGHINALHLINIYGTPAQQNRWYADARNDKLFSVWNSENGNGVSIHPLPGGRYRLTGNKIFCSGAHWVQRPLVTGKLIGADKEGWQMCIIPTEKVLPFKEDGSFWKPMGMKASASFKIDFTGIEIGKEDFLGAPDSYYKEPFFNGGAIRFAAVQLGGAIAVLNATHNFLQQYNRTGTDFQKARIAEMAMLAECGNNWINSTAEKSGRWINNTGNFSKNTVYVGMARTAMENICSRILYLSGVCTGPLGLMQNNVLERLHRDLTFYLRQPGPDTVIANIGTYLFNQKSIQNAWD